MATISSLAAADVDLKPILDSQTDIVLNGANSYYLANEYHLTKNVTIVGNDTHVTMQNGPLNARGGCTLTISDCILDGPGWAVLAAGQSSTLIVSDCALTGSGSNTGIFVAEGSTLTVDDSIIQSCWIGLNLVDSASGALHGIVVQSCDMAVQLGSGALTVDQNSEFTGGHGAGLAINEGGSLVVRDSTFTFYMNAIDIQPHSPGGTADVEGCAFYSADFSALSVGDAHDVRFANCLVQDAAADGVYYVRSTGTVENCRVLNSTMTGVTFFGCLNGATIRDSLVSGSGDQGVCVVADEEAVPNPSLNVRVVNNTFVDNTLCNVLVDAVSTAHIQGNILSQAPDASARFHGAHGSTMEGTLIVENYWAIEIRDSDLRLSLSAVMGHDKGGILAYQNAHPTLRHVDFHDNDRGITNDHSVFVNDGAVADLRGCTLGQTGERGLYNNAATCATNSCHNYWGTSQGPKEQWYGASPGATVEWNATNGSSVAFNPWLASPRVQSNYSATFSLSPGCSASWDSGDGVLLSLTARASASATGNQVVGALRCLDTTDLDSCALPTDFLTGHLYVVWVACTLREAVSEGSIRIQAPDVTETGVGLMRMDESGAWVQQEATWSLPDRCLVFSPSAADADLLNGIFALTLGAPPPTATPTSLPTLARDWALFD